MDVYGCMQYMPVACSLLLDCSYGQAAERTLYIILINPMIEWRAAVSTAQMGGLSPFQMENPNSLPFLKYVPFCASSLTSPMKPTLAD
jgi:hypothetical protein